MRYNTRLDAFDVGDVRLLKFGPINPLPLLFSLCPQRKPLLIYMGWMVSAPLKLDFVPQSEYEYPIKRTHVIHHFSAGATELEAPQRQM